ncbi:MarR family winged helix-turn-helix transcriptional regulator [Kineococcus terrestris]|uniref:MarR family winged helix-turn-helix transcriptional regulator n=1 Tax=Kineococcus terrestris TaxID=2044856 RepID=UPI0034DACA98
MDRVPLALLLLRASRWFDRQLLDGLEEAGWPRLSPAQSLVFAHLDARGVAPATLARRLGTSRQGAHELVAGLVRHGLLAVEPDPARAGGRLVLLTARGRALAADARRLLRGLEEQLGGERVAALRDLLADVGTGAGADATDGPS